MRLSRGTLHFSRWLDNEGVYRVPADSVVSGPSRRDPSFGVVRTCVVVTGLLDEKLTLERYGGTWREEEAAAERSADSEHGRGR